VRAKRPSKHGVRVAGRNEPHQNRAPRDVIRHMVAGSVASTHHGEPRTTQDIDLVIDADASQLLALVGQFDPERYYLSDPAAALGAGGQFNLIEPATGWKVDFILRRDRPFSRSEFDRRCPVTLFGVQTAVATAEDTILAKLEWPQQGQSDRQRRDVVSMLSVQRGHLDLDYLHRWASELGVESELVEAIRLAAE
jgi:hypothetical protein